MPPTDTDATHDWQLVRQPDGRLDLIDGRGERHVDVDVLRAFPISAPTESVSIVAADGHELAWIATLATVDPSLRRLLETELSLRDFLPVIERIETVSDGEPAEWGVVTDRGRRRFTVSHADDILLQPDGAAFITDAFGVRYAIRDLAALDPRSRRLLEKNL
jgi:hypothetical protein